MRFVLLALTTTGFNRSRPTLPRSGWKEVGRLNRVSA